MLLLLEFLSLSECLWCLLDEEDEDELEPPFPEPLPFPELAKPLPELALSSSLLLDLEDFDPRWW